MPNAFWEAHFRPCQSSSDNPSNPISYTAYNTNVNASLKTMASAEMAHLDMYSSESKKVSAVDWSLNSANSTYVDGGSVTPLSLATKFYIRY